MDDEAQFLDFLSIEKTQDIEYNCSDLYEVTDSFSILDSLTQNTFDSNETEILLESPESIENSEGYQREYSKLYEELGNETSAENATSLIAENDPMTLLKSLLTRKNSCEVHNISDSDDSSDNNSDDDDGGDIECLSSFKNNSEPQLPKDASSIPNVSAIDSPVISSSTSNEEIPFSEKFKTMESCKDMGDMYIQFPYYANKFYKVGLNYAQDMKLYKYEAYFTYRLGTVGEILRSPGYMDYFYAHLKLAKKMNDNIQELKANWNLGKIHFDKRNYRKSLDFSVRHYELCVKIDDKVGMNIAKNAIMDTRHQLGMPLIEDRFFKFFIENYCKRRDIMEEYKKVKKPKKISIQPETKDQLLNFLHKKQETPIAYFNLNMMSSNNFILPPSQNHKNISAASLANQDINRPVAAKRKKFN